MALGLYILNSEGEVVKTDDQLLWSVFMVTPLRLIASEELFDGTRVSTVFLGLNHNHMDPNDEDPILWETMVFGGKNDGFCQRYRTWQDALRGHRKIIDHVMGRHDCGTKNS